LQPFSTRFSKTMAAASKSSTVVGTADGGIGLLVPVDERTYRRLALLQQIMAFTVQMPLSLNPREYRMFKSRRFRFHCKKGVLDGCILWLYPQLHPTLQDELAGVLGVTSYIIKENLREIECLTSFF
jgi:cleavage and polyadenylation specificity factor subunit 1